MADIIFPGQPALDNIGVDRLPANLDLSIWQGDAQTYILKLAAQDGTPIDVTGYTPSATIRASFSDPVLHEFTCTQTGTNEITLYMSTPDVEAITPGSYVWQFQLVAPNGDARTYLAGDVTIYAEVA
jgi:hypothetical protein